MSEPPGVPFLDFYRQSLALSGNFCVRSGCCSFFTFEDEEGLPGPAASPSAEALVPSLTRHDHRDENVSQRQLPVPWPLLLFSELPSLPPSNFLNECIRLFQENFVASVPFLSRMSPVSLSHVKAPSYLFFAMALLGAATSDSSHFTDWTRSLWKAGDNLITGVAEIDNSESRKIDWIKAVSDEQYPCGF